MNSFAYFCCEVIMPGMNIFTTLFVSPVVNMLVLFYKGFAVLGLPGSLGLSIIAITVGIRLAINPLMKRQIEQSKKMAELQPHISKLQKKHKKNPKKLQAAQMELFKKHNVNPGFGCIVLILQIPIFYGLYTALRTIVVNGGMQASLKTINSMLYFPFLHINSLDVGFLGFNLSRMPKDWSSYGWWYLAVPVVTAGLQAYQSYLTTKTSAVNDKKKNIKKDSKSDEDKKGIGSDMQQMMQKQMLYFLPLMIAWVSFNFPVGVALYWNIFTIFGIYQYRSMLNPSSS